jgi:hypothetical protein
MALMAMQPFTKPTKWKRKSRLPAQCVVLGKINSGEASVQISSQSTSSKSTAFHAMPISHRWQSTVANDALRSA